MRAKSLFRVTTVWEYPGGQCLGFHSMPRGPGSRPNLGKCPPPQNKKNPGSYHSKCLIWVSSLNPHKNPITSNLLLSRWMMKKLGPERLYNLPRAGIFNWERDAGGWQVNLRWNSSPHLSLLLSLWPQANGFISQKLFSHLSVEDNVMGAQGYRENLVT